jgi:hypothetical protein
MYRYYVDRLVGSVEVVGTWSNDSITMLSYDGTEENGEWVVDQDDIDTCERVATLLNRVYAEGREQGKKAVLEDLENFISEKR